MRFKTFTAIGEASGSRFALNLVCFRDGKALLTTTGCACYYVDPITGSGIDERGYKIQVIPSALKRLQREYMATLE